MTQMLHHLEGEYKLADQMRIVSPAHLAQSETAHRKLAENYVELPY